MLNASKNQVPPRPILCIMNRAQLSFLAFGTKETRSFLELQKKIQSFLIRIKHHSLDIPRFCQAQRHCKQLLLVHRLSSFADRKEYDTPMKSPTQNRREPKKQHLLWENPIK
jgi:hypothetical protein